MTLILAFRKASNLRFCFVSKKNLSYFVDKYLNEGLVTKILLRCLDLPTNSIFMSAIQRKFDMDEY